MPIEAASASKAIMGTRDRVAARALENFITGFLTVSNFTATMIGTGLPERLADRERSRW